MESELFEHPLKGALGMEREVLYTLLNKVKARITLQRGVRLAFAGLLGGSAAGVILLGLGRLFPLLHVELWLLTLCSCGIGTGVAVGIWKRATVREAARAVDHGGAEDAVMTALDVLEGKTRASEAIVRLQREAASEATIEYVDRLKEKLPWPTWRQWRKAAIGLASLWLVAAALLLSPNPMKDKAQAMSETKAVLEELQSEIEEGKDEFNEAALNEEDRLKLEQTLEELRKELESLGLDNSEVLKELADTLEKLGEIAEETKQAMQSLQDISREMSKTRGLEELGQALEQMNAEAVDQAIDRLRNEMKELSQEERAQLADLLEELASMQESKGAEDLQEALQEAAEQMRNGEAAASAEENDGLSALQDALGEGLSKAALEQLARSMADRISEGGSRLAEGLSQQGGEVPSSWSEAVGKSGTSGSNSGSGENSGSQNGANGNAGSGQPTGETQGNGGQTPGGSQGNGGQSPGQGQGGASGSGGQGAGSGTGGQGSGNGSGTGGQGSGSGGQGAGLGAGDRNLVTTPRSLEGEGNVEVDGGPATGGETQTGGQSPVIDGTTRPYEDVYNEYAAEAKKSLGRTKLPASLQDKVKQYFDEIQPDR